MRESCYTVGRLQAAAKRSRTRGVDEVGGSEVALVASFIVFAYYKHAYMNSSVEIKGVKQQHERAHKHTKRTMK